MGKEYPVALPKGTVLAGQYVIEKVLGQGGFGITYKALDHKTKGYVAVKEFFPDTMVTREGITVVPYTGERGEIYGYGKECFLQEAETLGKFIGNENIVRIFSYFEENGTAYFVMEYIEGKSFDEYIKEKGGKVTFDEAYDILGPVIDALAVVHSKGIVHRDVTPDNIYITNDGKIKLLDFGAARYSIGDRSQSLDVVLKHGFAPKEQYTRRGKQGPYTDVYSLGATFYYAVTGKRPPDSIDRLEEDELIPPSARGVKMGRIAEQAILHAMNVQPKDRFQTMTEFKNAMTSSVEYDVMEAKAATGYLTRSDRPGATDNLTAAAKPTQPAPSDTPKPVEPKKNRFGEVIEEAPSSPTSNNNSYGGNGGIFDKKNRVKLIIGIAGVLLLIIGIAAAVKSGNSKKKDNYAYSGNQKTEATTKKESTTKATTEKKTTEKKTTEATTKATTEKKTTEATTENRDIKTPNGNDADAAISIYDVDDWLQIDESLLGMSYDDLKVMYDLPALVDWDYSLETLEYCDSLQTINGHSEVIAFYFKNNKLVALRCDNVADTLDDGMARTVINFGGTPDTGLADPAGNFSQYDFKTPGGNNFCMFLNYYEGEWFVTQEYATRKYITRDFTASSLDGDLEEVPIYMSTFEDDDYYD